MLATVGAFAEQKVCDVLFVVGFNVLPTVTATCNLTLLSQPVTACCRRKMFDQPDQDAPNLADPDAPCLEKNTVAAGE